MSDVALGITGYAVTASDQPNLAGLVELPDEVCDDSMWSDAEHEGFGAPDRHAP